MKGSDSTPLTLALSRNGERGQWHDGEIVFQVRRRVQ